MARRRASARLLEMRVTCASREGIVVMMNTEVPCEPFGLAKRLAADISFAY